MQRITSTASPRVDLKIPSVSKLFQPQVSYEETYKFTLKLLILDYINEPRFAFSSAKQLTKKNDAAENIPLSHIHKSDTRNLDIIGNKIDENYIIQELLPSLDRYLNKVATKQIDVSEQNTRRSLLKFYNDMFLNPDQVLSLKSLTNFEELMMYFIKIANIEIQKIGIQDVNAALHQQIAFFINVIIYLLPTSISPSIIDKLKSYRNIIKEKENINRDSVIYSKSMGPIGSVSKFAIAPQNYNVQVRQPTFRIDEINHSKFLMNIFGIDEIKFQQDIIEAMNEAKNEIYMAELQNIEVALYNNEWSLKSVDFKTDYRYEEWKQFEISELNKLKDKFICQQEIGSNKFFSGTLIPTNREEIYLTLVSLILKNEFKTDSFSLSLSSDATYFIFKMAMFWRLNFPTKLASLIYTAANITIFKQDELNSKITENLLGIINTRILSVEYQNDVTLWNRIDENMWASNLYQTSNQCLFSLSILFNDLYKQPKPKFSPILSFYYTHIANDPLFHMFCKTNEFDSESVWCKLIKNKIFSASETYYISLLEKVPKDGNLSLQHIQILVNDILKELKSLQKKYPRKLFDKLLIFNESVSILTKLLSTDIEMIIRHIKEVGTTISPSVSLEAYCSLSNLRNFYLQIYPQKRFPFKIEKLFINDLFHMADDISLKISNTITIVINSETWEIIDQEGKYSTSVIDIFKIFHESMSIFFNLHWEDRYQISRVITFLLKTFSDSLSLYIKSVLKIIIDDLITGDVIEEYQFKQQSTRALLTFSSIQEQENTTWSFTELKKALNFREVLIPKPFEYTLRSCVILNNIDAMLSKIDDIDDRISSQKLSDFRIENNDIAKLAVKLHQLYTIKIISAYNIVGFNKDSSTNASVSVIDSETQQEIFSTQIVHESCNPVWKQTFQYEQLVNETKSLNIMVWHHPSGLIKNNNKHELCGKTTLLLDSNNFKKNGDINDIVLKLGTQGELFLHLSLEEEQFNPVFCIGRIYRMLDQSKDIIIQNIIFKFNEFIHFTFSRDSLKLLHGGYGTRFASKELIHDMMQPFFDYLNANLNILAKMLTEQLLHETMLEAWNEILKTAFALLLPPLSVINITRKDSRSTGWNGKVNLKLFKKNDIKGYGRPLTQIESETIFEWLNILCKEFFYNNGEGPSLHLLKNERYEEILLIPLFYDKSTNELINDMNHLSKMYLKYLHKCIAFDNISSNFNLKATIITRQKTIAANSSKVKRIKIKQELKEENDDILEKSITKLDLILKILITRQEIDVVRDHLEWRKEMKNKLLVEAKVKAAVNGRSFK